MNALDIVLNCVKELNEVWEKPELSNPDKDTFLYGKRGCMDSINLISLIADIEMAVYDESGINVTIADEKAMSESRSPFKTVQSLAAFIDVLMLHQLDLNG